MNDKSNGHAAVVLLALLGGATLGAMAAALAAPGRGKMLLERLRTLTGRLQGKAAEAGRAEDEEALVAFI